MARPRSPEYQARLDKYPSQGPEARRDGYTGRTATDYDRAYAAKRHAYRREMLNVLKAEAGCMDCEGSFHPEILEFDHVRGEKAFTISSRVGMNIQRLQEEIWKCDIVCANCHRMRTISRRAMIESQSTHAASAEEAPAV